LRSDIRHRRPPFSFSHQGNLWPRGSFRFQIRIALSDLSASVIVLTAAIVADDSQRDASKVCHNDSVAAHRFAYAAQIVQRITGSGRHLPSFIGHCFLFLASYRVEL
jgi:hypothetical protein